MLEMIWFRNILLFRIEAGQTGEAGYGNGDENTPKMNIKNINNENNNMDMNNEMEINENKVKMYIIMCARI